MDSLITARWRTWAGTGAEHLVLRTTAKAFPPKASFGGAHGKKLTTDGAGSWTDGSGAPLAHLSGAIDVDLSASPFTNTLPIRRLLLAQGRSADILVAYIAFPELTVAIDRQRYTCLEPDRSYRFESLDSDFSRDIEVDGDGLVVTYPGLFRRTL
jgi:hypothetical protein